MNPKNKAIDLIKKFDVKYYYKLTKGQLPVSMHNSVIKECVLHAIDEILNLLINTYNWDIETNGNIHYWQKVKEIVSAEFDQLYQAVP
jgi:hypothetical protein